METPEINEVTVFAFGDSRDISLWSNVPYMFTTTLASKGIRINRVDISPSYTLEQAWKSTLGRFHNWMNRDTTYDYFRSLTNFLHTRHRIRKAVERNKSSDLFIFLTFSFSSIGLTHKPSAQLCDWTYEHFIRYHKEKQPDIFERWSIGREESQISGSDFVFALFPKATEQLKSKYTEPEIHYVGNVFSSLVAPLPADEAIKGKKESCDIIFIGGSHYKQGADLLISAYSRLRKKIPSARIHIIGMAKEQFEFLPEGVVCHGYLDKGIAEQRDRYYELLSRARLLVNTTPKWGAFSGTVEAMYHYTPVIVHPYEEFEATFGETLNFGSYHEENSGVPLENEIESLILDPDYDEMCRNAHLRTKSFSWDRFVDDFLRIVDRSGGKETRTPDLRRGCIEVLEEREALSSI